MKFLHISDLHIGKRVKNYSMLDNQRDILRQIIDIINRERPDGVLIAGDIYDRMNPSEAAIECLDDFMVKLSEIDTQVFVLSAITILLNRLPMHPGLSRPVEFTCHRCTEGMLKHLPWRMSMES